MWLAFSATHWPPFLTKSHFAFAQSGARNNVNPFISIIQFFYICQKKGLLVFYYICCFNMAARRQEATPSSPTEMSHSSFKSPFDFCIISLTNWLRFERTTRTRRRTSATVTEGLWHWPATADDGLRSCISTRCFWRARSAYACRSSRHQCLPALVRLIWMVLDGENFKSHFMRNPLAYYFHSIRNVAHTLFTRTRSRLRKSYVVPIKCIPAFTCARSAYTIVYTIPKSYWFRAALQKFMRNFAFFMRSSSLGGLPSIVGRIGFGIVRESL